MSTPLLTSGSQVRVSRVRIFTILTSFIIFIAFIVSLWATLRSLKRDEVTRVAICPELHGNQDMYGLGIRLGIYLQLIVTSVVDILGSQKTSLQLAPSTLWFLIAMFVALMTMIRDPRTYAFESYIVISLGNGITWILVGGAIKLDPLTPKESLITSFGRFLIWGVWRAASSAYWWSLGNGTYRELKGGCGPWGWFFLKVNLHGWFQTLQQVFNIISWVGLIHSILPYFVGSTFFVLVVLRMDPKLLKQHGISKISIICDYVFEEVGVLRGILFGSPKHDGPSSESQTDGSTDPDSDCNSEVGHVVLMEQMNIEKHIKERYKMNCRSITYVQPPVNSNVLAIDQGQTISQSAPRSFAPDAQNAVPADPSTGIGDQEQISSSGSQINVPGLASPSSNRRRSESSWKSVPQALPPSSHSSFDNTGTVPRVQDEEQIPGSTPQPHTHHLEEVPPPNLQSSPTAGNKSKRLNLNVLYWGRDNIVQRIERYGMSEFPLLPLWDICSVLVTILTVEFTVKLNNINDVYHVNSAGQLVALVAGVGGAFIAIGNFYCDKRGIFEKKLAS